MNRRVLVAWACALVASCGGRAGVEHPAPDPEALVLAHLPSDALFVARADVGALRRTSAWEAAIAAAGSAPPELRAGLEAIDRIYLSVGPMMQLPAAFVGVPDEDDLDADAGVEPDAAIDEPDAGVELDPFALPIDEEIQPPVTSGGDAWYREWFGDALPGFALLVVPRAGRSACDPWFATVEGTPRRVGDYTAIDAQGFVLFRGPDGICGVTVAPLFARVRREGPLSAAATRLLAAKGSGDLGFLASANHGGGALLREWLTHVRGDRGPTERIFVDWLARVSEIVNRGVVGSSAVIRARGGHYSFETHVEYDDPIRAAAHGVIADTARELTDVTLDALASAFGGAIPRGLAHDLVVEARETELTMRWNLPEATLTTILESLLGVREHPPEIPFGDALSDEITLATLSFLPGPSQERIEMLEPKRAELEESSAGAAQLALRRLGLAYAVRGRFVEADEVLARARARAVELGSGVDRARADLARAQVLVTLGDLEGAERALGLAIGDCEAGSDCGAVLPTLVVRRASVARSLGHGADAEAWLTEASALPAIELDDVAAIVAERARAVESGSAAEAMLASLTSARALLAAMPTRSLEAEHRLAEAELDLASRLGRPERALEPLATLRASMLAADEDPQVASAGASRDECEARGRDARDPEAIPACERAVAEAIEAHGEVHPDVAAARIALASAELAARDVARARAELERASAALGDLPTTHPLRARIARLARGRR